MDWQPQAAGFKLSAIWAALCITISASFFSASPARAQGVSDSYVLYQFKRGDTLIALGSKYFRRASDYKRVQRINRIRNPRQIAVGRNIRIPFALLKYRPSQARLSAYRGNIAIAESGRQIAPEKGLELSEGSQLVTAGGGFLTLSLEDGSRVSMPSNSKMRITRLRHVLLTDSIDYEFAVDNGRIRSKVTPFDRRDDRYRVRTPVAVSAVRGTDYRTRVDGDSGTAFSETVEGEVAVASGNDLSGTAITIGAGTGAAASVTGALIKGDLLPPPELADPAKVQSDAALQFTVLPDPRAAAHRIILSTDAGFVDLVAEQLSDTATVTLPGVPDGRYFAKVTSIAKDGFEGMPNSYAFKRVLATLSGSAGKGDFGYRFKWDGEGSGERVFRFQLFKESTASVPVVDETGLRAQVLTLSDLPDGEYFWRVGVTQFSDGELFQKWSEFEKLTVAG